MQRRGTITDILATPEDQTNSKTNTKHLYEIPHMQGGESLDLVPVTLSERHEMDNDQYRLQERAPGKSSDNTSYSGSQYIFFFAPFGEDSLQILPLFRHFRAGGRKKRTSRPRCSSSGASAAVSQSQNSTLVSS